jgi:hypothetical protein
MAQRTDSVERTLAMIQASRALRERQAERRRETFSRIELANLRKPNIPKGVQLRLNLQ